MLQQPLPVGVNGRALEHGFDGLNRFASKLSWAGIQYIHHQAGMAPTLETHPNQITRPNRALPQV
jgi:hypothetical protein